MPDTTEHIFRQQPVRAYVRQFAKWCAIHADQEPDDAFVLDYMNNFTLVYRDDWYRIIDVALGAFDHGAGNAMLIIQGNKAWVAYEGDMTLFTEGRDLKGLPT